MILIVYTLRKCYQLNKPDSFVSTYEENTITLSKMKEFDEFGNYFM